MVSVCLPSDDLLQHLPSYLVSLTRFLLPWAWGISSRLLQQRAATAPYLGREVSPHHHPSWSSVWDRSSRPSCACAATARWMWGLSSVLINISLETTYSTHWLQEKFRPLILDQNILKITKAFTLEVSKTVLKLLYKRENYVFTY